MIFNENNYKKYLMNYISKLPKRGYGEAKKISDVLDVSTAFVSSVLSGDRDLSLEQAHLLSEYMGHNKLEAEYFFYLVQHERSGHHKLKKYCENKLALLKKESLKLGERLEVKKTLSDEEKSIFYSNAVYSAAHLYSSVGEKGISLDELAQRFELSRGKASEILTFLVSCGLCIEHGGRYKMGTQSTYVGIDSPHLLKHHANWRIRAIQASENLSAEELMSTINVSLSKEDFTKLRERLVGVIDGFLKTVYPSPAEDIACFNMDFFWIRK